MPDLTAGEQVEDHDPDPEVCSTPVLTASFEKRNRGCQSDLGESHDCVDPRSESE